ncbi:MAG: hypothetical protein LBR52_04325 [Prevotellaceae bacterium]|nr:hypothetical protein [Prevotellaceae bacterium]
MKIFRFFLLLPVLFISSCADKYVTEEYYTEEVVMNTKTVYYTVSSTDWKLFDVPPEAGELEESGWTYFYYDFREPFLTNMIFDNGVMNAYLVMDAEKEIISPLPFDDYYQGNYMWTEQVTCEFSPQNVRFIVKYNDFDVQNRDPWSYTFMVRLAW